MTDFGRPTKFDPAFHDVVLEVGLRGGSVVEMAVACGVSRSTFYDFIQNDEDFSDTVARARDLAQVWWETKGREATEGKITNFSANAFTFQMRNRFADYRDVQHVEQNIATNGETMITGIQHRIVYPPKLDLSKLSEEELEQLASIVESQKAPKPLTIDHEQTEESK